MTSVVPSSQPDLVRLAEGAARCAAAPDSSRRCSSLPCPARRDFLRNAVLALGVAGVAGLLEACAPSADDDTPTPSPTPLPYLVYTLALNEHPELKTPGGWLSVSDDDYQLHVIVMRIDVQTMATLWQLCPHGACSVEFLPEEGIIKCPCHGSEFATDGSLLQGPATRGLTAYPTHFDEATVYITTRVPV